MIAKKLIVTSNRIKIIFLVALLSKSNFVLATVHCSITALPVNFGIYNPLSLAPDNTSSNIQLTCNGGDESAYQIALSTGSSGSYTPRKMFQGVSWLNYNLYLNAAYSTIWGNGTNGTGLVTGASKDCKNNSPCNYTVHAQIPAGQTAAPAGNFTDTITVTVSY